MLRGSAPIRLPISPRTGPHSILIVVDDRDSREALHALLLTEGHEVRSAADGSAALSLAAHRAPDVVLLDINMPVMDGYAICRRLRDMGSLAATRIYALTALSGSVHYARCRVAGFDRHFGKPLDVEALMRLLRFGAG
jgi:two-component system OmpR family response regulator